MSLDMLLAWIKHQRIDRDKYLMVIKMNIKSNRDEDFKRRNDRVFGAPNNFLPGMYYPYNSFSKSKETNMPTMLPRDPTLQYLLMEKHGVSHYDKLVLNYGYGCIETWRKKCTTKNYCQNYGYKGPNYPCVFPPGAHGASCEKLLLYPLPAYPPSPCDGHITETGIYSCVKSNKTLSASDGSGHLPATLQWLL
ncbi:hypothetical protein QYM36_010772 [Artemia franciscana]|uniref:Peptidase M12A domain-containing protein n=1 Tax=Artemia franciscana TaxID=6661 RepID=A0AA88L8G3_ARTSF|nr:hypothetical protein QYM36_010772 [Artemia franciscana]